MHEPIHDHTHDHHSPEETIALLRYMLQHNEHHAEELHDLAHGIEGEAEKCLHEAVVDLRRSNERISHALILLGK